jgi:hypothetical protein
LRDVKRQVKCASEQQSAPSKHWMQSTMPKRVEPDTDQDENIQSNRRWVKATAARGYFSASATTRRFQIAKRWEV